ncbi:MAG: putative rRNA maturation factor [candidate division WWE3 bacterium GW2011_GWA1_46_21]|uniref:Putative rRNA maturation factor n=2 Tax=Katanobacteria TaxID=422282 RepID=A0A0G1PBI1_UNCKA|nr:MAG: putative rRNA maturation factor [candidate division WWE3 bacterium GW2011_GWA1_46_21]KKU49647.1 MAG: putative rRNA maturation factor [candidate division WWE3 bacterium GW2011_GWC1_47_10]
MMRNNSYISISIVGDSQMQKLNKKHLDKDHTTDVLSFNMDELRDDGVYYIGDVIVNADQARRQAAQYKNTFEEEISQLAAHGILHLLGVHHAGDE